MISREVKVVNEIGLHARPATLFIQEANKYKSSIWVIKGDRQVNAKSLLGVLSLAVTKGMEIVIKADGEDELAAVDDLKALIESGLSTENKD